MACAVSFPVSFHRTSCRDLDVIYTCFLTRLELYLPQSASFEQHAETMIAFNAALLPGLRSICPNCLPMNSMLVSWYSLTLLYYLASAVSAPVNFPWTACWDLDILQPYFITWLAQYPPRSTSLEQHAGKVLSRIHGQIPHSRYKGQPRQEK